MEGDLQVDRLEYLFDGFLSGADRDVSSLFVQSQSEMQATGGFSEANINFFIFN